MIKYSTIRDTGELFRLQAQFLEKLSMLEGSGELFAAGFEFVQDLATCPVVGVYFGDSGEDIVCYNQEKKFEPKDAIQLSLKEKIINKFGKTFDVWVKKSDLTLFFIKDVKPQNNEVLLMRVGPENAPCGLFLFDFDRSSFDLTQIEFIKNLIRIITLAVTKDREIRITKNREERFRKIIDEMPALFCAVSEDGKVVYWNEEFKKVTGYESSDIIGHPNGLSLLNPEMGKARRLAKRIEEEKFNFRNLEWYLVTKDGKKRDVLFSSQSENVSFDDWSSWSVGIDITKRKNAERTLKKVSQNLKKALRQGNIATWEIDPQNKKIISANNTEGLIGYVLADLRKMDWETSELISSNDKAEIKQSFKDYLKGKKKVFERVVSIKSQAGKNEWIYLRGKIVEFDALNLPVRMLGTAQNVTDQIEMEQRLRQSQKMEAIGRLAGGIAHDFNNLLQVILGYSELVKEEIQNLGGSSADVEQIVTAGDKALKLVKQLLSFSHVKEVNMEFLDLGNKTESAINSLKWRVSDNVKIEFNNKVTDVSVFIDPLQYEQVVRHLIINACDAMENEGEINVSIERISLADEEQTVNGTMPIGNYAVLRVEDQGSGIEKQNIEHIFEPFFTTKEVGKGTGLGLAMVYAFLGRHNSYITVESIPDEGTFFSIYIPERNSEESLVKDKSGRKIIPENATTGKILVAEDDPMVRKLTVRTLVKAGYDVLEAEDGKKAVEVFKENRAEISLLLFDVIMPEMNGREAYDKIAEIDNKVPVLFVSGYTSDLLESEYMLKIPGKMLEKPVQKKVLLDAIKDILFGSN